jgi:hypothetical protein
MGKVARAKLVKRGARSRIQITDGTVLVGGDSHNWPSRKAPVAHRGFVHLARELQPAAVVFNGDALDGAKISRHTRIGWENNPTVLEELEATTSRMSEVEDAAKADVLSWNLGNHDMRFETFLASRIPEYEGVKGIHLKDHFPQWNPAWSTEIGGKGGAIAKHRFKGGKFASIKNAQESGRTILTGHDHKLYCMALSDYDETRWGCHTGMLGQPYGPQFVNYTEDAPVDWQPGFLVLTFHRGKLLPPEPVYAVSSKEVAFRGQVMTV